MKKRWIIGPVIVLGVLAAIGATDGKTPAPGTEGRSSTGWTLAVTGAAGVQADCSWEVMQGASSHSGSRTVVTPTTLSVGDADMVSATCQKKEAGTSLLRVRLMRDGDLKQSSDATGDYGVASVSST